MYLINVNIFCKRVFQGSRRAHLARFCSLDGSIFGKSHLAWAELGGDREGEVQRDAPTKPGACQFTLLFIVHFFSLWNNEVRLCS